MASIIHFGECSLFVGERRLECRGQPIKLGSRALDLLTALALRKGEVVALQDLVRHAWPKTIVTESSLRVHIGQLRKALNAASPENARAILNIPGRGYLLADMAACPAEPAGQVVTSAATPAAARSRVPCAIGRVFGRDAVVRQVRELLAPCAIVTLVAPGGMGKTTVALALAQASEGAGIPTLWVDLSGTAADERVAHEVARAAGAVPTGDPSAALVHLLRGQGRQGRCLLVLDCCECAVAGVTALAEYLVQQLPGLRILATSREPLHAQGERVLRLPPLGIGDCAATSADAAAHGPAVELFVERAQAADLPLRLPQDLPLVAQICRGLDGMPLAIELAAAHLVGFGLQDLAAMIDSGFQLGNLGRRTAPARHRTLETAFEWSYRLLDPMDRQVLEWLSVFEGGASLRAILDVLAGTGLTPTQIAHSLARLTDKSLVKCVPAGDGGGASFHRLLDTTRSFAARRLYGRGEVQHARRAHAQYLLRAVSASQVEGQGNWVLQWLGPCAPNLANLRGALAWTRSEPPECALALALAAASAPTFLQLSLLEECEQHCERALALLPMHSDTSGQEATRLMAYRGAAMLGTHGPVDASLQAMRAAHARAEQASDAPSRALALSGLFWLWIYRGEPAPAIEAAQALHEAGNGDTASTLLRDRALAYASTLAGDQNEALSRLLDVQERNLRLSHGQFMRIGSDPNVFSHVFLAKTHWLRGDIDQARSLYQRHLASLQKPEHGLYYCWALNELIIPLHCFLGEWQAARAAAQELADAATRQTMRVRQHAAACAALAIDLLEGRGDLQAYLDAVDVLRAGHFASLLPWLDGVAAQEAWRRGHAAQAGLVMDRAIAHCTRTGNAWWLPELHRIRGQAMLTGQEPGDPQHGVSALRLACELAQRQHAAALWLSAAVGWASAVPPQDDGASGEVRAHLQGALAAAPAMAGHALGQEARRLLATASAATAPTRDGTTGARRADRPLRALAGAGAPATGASASIRGASPATAAAPESPGCP